MKVWIYKGEILPYKSAAEDKIAEGSRDGRRRDRRARARSAGSSAPVAVVAVRRGEAHAGRRPTATTSRPKRPTPLVKEADPELERLLAEEEEIERRTRQHHEAPQVPRRRARTDAC